ncbi:MAG: class I SAM-dependent methyltransferase [Candidatus Krumholzibacteria bacterium]|nr:class I SAM-dependent methyltransferase [Candidatus Krumholzibacteria bacterium]
MSMMIHGREFQIASLNEIHFKMVDILKTFPRGKVLDFPAGTGRLAWMLYNEGFDVTAADIGTDEFRNPEIPIVKGDLDIRFPFNDGTFDYACCVDGPEHAENIYHTFREFSRVLKKGGLFTMSYPNYSNIESRMRNIFYGVLEPVEPYNAKSYKNNGHISRPPYALLKMALNYAGLEIERIEGEKTKYNQFFLLPMAMIILLFTKIKGNKGRQKYWLDESNSWKILMGGNAMILSTRKLR